MDILQGFLVFCCLAVKRKVTRLVFSKKILNEDTGEVEMIPIRQLLAQKFTSRQSRQHSYAPSEINDPDDFNETTCVQIQQNADSVD